MEIGVTEIASKLGLSFGASLTPTKCSIKFRNENACTSSSSSCSRPIKTPILCRSWPKRRSNGGEGRSKAQQRKELSLILRTEAAIGNIERKANSKKYNRLLPKAVLGALDEAIKTNSWQTALKIFALLRMQDWYEPRRQTYTKLLMMLGKCKQERRACELFKTMLSEDGLKPAVDVCTALVSAYANSGCLDDAFSALDDMKSGVYDPNCAPDVYTYSLLIGSCARQRRLDLVPRLLDEMSVSGIEKNDVTYNTLVHAYGNAGMFEKMESVLEDMIESDFCRPNVVTMNSVVGAYGNAGRIEEMERWHNEFRVMGIEPDAKTFNILIKSFGRAQMFEKMNLVVSFMEGRFFGLDVVTFNTVVDSYGRAGDVDSMESQFNAMKHRGVKPNSVTYSSLMSAFGRAGQIERVDSVMRQARNSDAALDTPFFNSAIDAYGRSGEVGKMSQCFLAMRERGCCPDHITLATMARAFEAHGLSDVARDFEKVMLSTKDYSDIVKFLPK